MATQISPNTGIAEITHLEGVQRVHEQQTKVFSHLTAEKSELYRDIMTVFMAAKHRFQLYLRPTEVVSEISRHRDKPPIQEIQYALTQLRDWGNLDEYPDCSEVRSAAEWNTPRWLYQISKAGEAGEQALTVFREVLGQDGELQTAALEDIQVLLHEILAQSRSNSPDAGKVHRLLDQLLTRFEGLANRAQAFIRSLQRAIDLRDSSLARFIEYKNSLIQYLEHFVAEFVIASDAISQKLLLLEEAGIDRLLSLAAERSLSDALAPGEAATAATHQSWQQGWEGLSSWFVGKNNAPPLAHELRRRARRAIPDLLHAIESLHERRHTSSDRAADLRTLAVWFMQQDSEYDAHRLWRTSFGLASSRHLCVNDETVERWENEHVSASTRWADAPQMCVSPRLRATGSYTRRGRPTSVIDRRADKVELAKLAQSEAKELAHARQLLATGRRTRLSELEKLSRTEFALFLDLLGDGLSHVDAHGCAKNVTSADGSMDIELEPTRDGTTATIETTNGWFTGEDYFITIVDQLQDDAGGQPQ